MKFIVAVDINYGIGYRGNLLEKIPEDIKFFKNVTLGNIVVMGRRTYESLPNKMPLPKRDNIILTRNNEFKADGFRVFNDIYDIFRLSIDSTKEIYIIGGGEIYDIFLDYCESGYLTIIKNSYTADSYFPKIDLLPNWNKEKILKNDFFNSIEYSIIEYKNKNIKDFNKL